MGTAVTINGSAQTVPEDGDTGWELNLRNLLSRLARRVSGVLVFGGTSAATNGDTFCLYPFGTGTPDGTERPWVAPHAGVLSDFYVRTTSNYSGSPGLCNFRLNHNEVASTDVSIDLETGTSAASLTTEEVTVAAGDRISFLVASEPGSSGAANPVVTMRFRPA